MAENIIIKTEGLSKKYRKNVALEKLDLEVTSGSIVGLLGKNGAGKTTLNKLITGLNFPTSGTIEVFGEIPKGGQRNVGFLSENIAIYPNMNARENIEISILQDGKSANKADIDEILNAVSIKNSKKKQKTSHLE